MWDIRKQLRVIRMQFWNIPELCESLTSRYAEVVRESRSPAHMDITIFSTWALGTRKGGGYPRKV